MTSHKKTARRKNIPSYGNNVAANFVTNTRPKTSQTLEPKFHTHPKTSQTLIPKLCTRPKTRKTATRKT